MLSLEFVIPYFGPRALLEEAVVSVLQQTHGRWRLLVVEDGDQGQGVGEWLAGLGDSRIEHVVNSATLGVAGNFQRCLDLSTADLVTFLGCDDRLLPHYAQHVLMTMSNDPSLAGVFPAVTVIDELGSRCLPLVDRVKAWLRPASPDTIQGERLLSSLALGNWTYFPATCWRREAISAHGFRQDLDVVLDLELLMRLVLEGGRFAVGAVPAFEYRRHRQSASSTALGDASRLREERLVYEAMAARARAQAWSRAALSARLRLTSRLHAATRLPAAVRHVDDLTVLGRHVFGP